jgi:A/G-specific adenine glycosylase
MAATGRSFVRRLLRWYKNNARDLPWRRTSEPYRIWVSEIMLQQTRVEAVIPYYERFLRRYPDIAALAAAPEQELLEAWAGLGYYRRARLLQRAAREIVAVHGGEFPREYGLIRALPGIGNYTAAAIAGIAFDLPYAVLDGNVTRLLTRLENDGRDITKAATKRALAARAQELMGRTRAGERGAFNQALMELGATVCTPRSPKCGACPWMKDCRAFAEGTAESLPYKSSRMKTRRVALAVAIVRRSSSLLMRQRPADEEIMPGFWELPYLEGVGVVPDRFSELGLLVGLKLREFKHSITDRLYQCTVYEANLDSKRPEKFRWITPSRLSRLPVTTISKKALNE